jgi:hypothetical protein
VPAAKVTVTNAGTQVSWSMVTDKDGHFEALDPPLGIIEWQSSTTVNRTVTQNQKLQINQSLRFDITLKLGATNQTFTVEAQVSGVET